MEQKWIEIRGAKENNLKNISLNILGQDVACLRYHLCRRTAALR